MEEAGDDGMLERLAVAVCGVERRDGGRFEDAWSEGAGDGDGAVCGRVECLLLLADAVGRLWLRRPGPDAGHGRWRTVEDGRGQWRAVS
jgi:hypothetical protein